MKKLNQKGVVSLISVAILSLILTIIVTAYFRSATTQQAEAINLDFGVRAYYSAEAGAQDAIRYLIANPNASKTNCAPISGNGVLGNGLKYTCQLIDNNLTYITFGGNGDDISENTSVQVAVPPNTTKARIRWESPASNIRNNSQKTLSTKAIWNNSDTRDYPAMLRTSLYTHPNGNFVMSSMQNFTSFLNPTFTAESLTYSSTSDNFTPANQSEELIYNSECKMLSTATISRCEFNLGMSDFNFGASKAGYLRFKPIYKNVTKLTVEFFNGSAQIWIPNIARVDVTGSYSNILRRVTQQVSLVSDPTLVPRRDNLAIPDLSIGSADEICKLQIRTSTFYNSQCI